MVNDSNRSEIYYFDDKGNTVAKEEATRVIVRELDAQGNLVNETFGVQEIPIIDEVEPRHYHDVWNWESEHGSWIVAMQRAGIDRETIIAVLKKHKGLKLSPHKAATAWWKFQEAVDNG